MSATMQGRRVSNPFAPSGALLSEWPAPGDYWRNDDGTWHAETPNGLGANLGNHEVSEHEDGTITVSPSILVTAHDGSWHGYLERGVWRSC